MSRWHDKIDWIGGDPFELAKPARIFDFCRSCAYLPEKLVTNAGGMTCNESLVRRAQP